MRKNKIDFFQPGGKKFLNGDKPDQDTFEDLTDSVTFPTELTDRAKVSESGLTKTTTDLKVNTGDDTDQSGISPLGFPVIVKPSQLWRLFTSDPQVVLAAVTRVPGSPVDSEDGSLIEDIEISLNLPAGSGVTGADNGLTLVTGNVEIGGTLTKDTTVLGASTYDLIFSNLDDFVVTLANYVNINATTSIQLIAGTNLDLFGEGVHIMASGSIGGKLRITTPLLGTASNGYVLTLINSATGESEWQTLPAASTNIYLADGTLLGNRTLNGGSFNLTFTNITTLSTTTSVNALDFTSLSSAQLVSDNVLLSGTSTLLLATPGVNGATAILNQVLTLTNAATGQCEWQTPPTGSNTELATNDQNLTGNRIISGGSSPLYSLYFQYSDFIGTQVGVIDITWSGSGTTTIDGGTLRITEGGMVGKSVGDVLVLKNASTGECEWEGGKFVRTFTAVAGALGSDSSIAWVFGSWPAFSGDYSIWIQGAVHGKGLYPQVTMYEAFGGGPLSDARPISPLNLSVDVLVTGDVRIAVSSPVAAIIIIS